MTPSRHAAGAAFTLIELLIVVAIIAILAAIAVPNFLEAQMRARVSRVHAELRSLATALESYRIDENHYPPGPVALTNPAGRTQTWRLTTPVAYLAAVPVDGFVPPPGSPALGGPFGFYGIYLHFINGENEPMMDDIWMAFSFGPDRKMAFNALRYDPSNGTVSAGDIYRMGPPGRPRRVAAP